MSRRDWKIEDVRPKLIKRACGGWLAVSEEGSPIGLGVEGASEQDARTRFEEAVREWRALADADRSAPN